MITESSAVELSEVQRITKNVAVLIDSERKVAGATLEADRQKFVNMCGRLAIKCDVLERRAIENYFTDRVVKTVKGPKYRSLGPFEELAAPAISWAKAENWRLAREMTKAELDATDLGRILSTA